MDLKIKNTNKQTHTPLEIKTNTYINKKVAEIVTVRALTKAMTESYKQNHI